jgi:hypothetical protein
MSDKRSCGTFHARKESQLNSKSRIEGKSVPCGTGEIPKSIHIIPSIDAKIESQQMIVSKDNSD